MFPSIHRRSNMAADAQVAQGKPRLTRRRLAAAGLALVPALGLFAGAEPSAFAGSPPQISVLVSSTYPCTPVVGTPCPPYSSSVSGSGADVSPLESAVDPTNGDVAITSSNNANIYLYANSSQAMFGLGTLQPGYTYVIAGTGTTGGVTPGELATSSKVKASFLSFDNSGNLLFGQTTPNTVDVIANTTAGAYGYSSLTPGDLYQVAQGSNGTAASPVVKMPVTTVNLAINSLAVDSSGDVFVSLFAYGIAVIDEATSGTEVAYGATLTAQKSTLIVGSTTASYTALSSPQSATASPVESSDVAIDGYGNLVFDTASENGAGSNDTIWVLPEAPGSAAGTTGVSFGPYQIASVTAGDIYLIAGQEGDESESTNGVLATSADFDDVDSLTVDSEGNIIAGDEGTAFAVSVIAENPNAAYDISSSSWTVGDVYTLSGGSGATSINPSGNASSYETPPVDSVGWADPPGTGGYLFVDGDNLPTLADEYQISLAPSPSAIITQTSPTTGNGTTSTPMPNTQLNFTGQGGTVSCAPGTEGDLTVTAGCVAEQTANATGVFTVTGNVTDSFGNTGSGTPEYTFSLDVGPSGGQVPESPIIVLLPVVALGAVGAVLFINRRRRVARTQS